MPKIKKRFSKSPELHVEPSNIQQCIRISDLRDLITWCLCQATPPSAPKWIGVENKNGIEHIVTLMVPGLPLGGIDLSLPQPQPLNSELSSFNSFDLGWPTKANCHKDRIDPPENTIAQVQFTKTERKKQSKLRKQLEENDLETLVPLADLLVPRDTMSRLGFVLEPPTSEWKVLPSSDDSADLTTAWAVDCEMCSAASGKVLTRVSVVNDQLECIYSTFVQPKEPIIDYLTQFSGITAELLEGVTTTLEDVQHWFVDNVKPGTVLVGHSIECDLEALKLVHQQCIDTGLLFPHPKGLPFKHALKWLIRKYFDSEIQNSGLLGHDPTEDAAACIKLLNLKRRKGIEFGNIPQAKCITQVLKDEGKTTAIIDYGVPFWDWSQTAQSVTSVVSDDEVVSRLKQQITRHSYTFAAFRELERCSPEQHDEVLAVTDRRIQEIVDQMPPRSLLIVWTGYGDRTVMKSLLAKRTTFRHEFRTKNLEEIEAKWTETDVEALNAAAQVGRMGISMIKMIPGELPRKRQRLEEPGETPEETPESSAPPTEPAAPEPST